MVIKEKDFIEIEYTGKIKDENIIFDTTSEKTAKDNKIFNEQITYKPIIICVGQGQLIKGLDKQLIGKETGKEYTFEIKPEEGFGKKSAKLLKIVPTSVFKKQNIRPVPGLQVNIDRVIGTIRTVTGGRTIVDFNHPLAGRDLVYQVKINKIITEDIKKIESFINLELGFKPEKIEIKENIAKIVLKKEYFDMIKDSKEKITNKIIELISNIKKVEFEEVKEKPKEKEVAKEKKD